MQYRIENNGVYNKDNQLLGEFTDNQFVPSKSLLEMDPKVHKAVDDFVKNNKKPITN